MPHTSRVLLVTALAVVAAVYVRFYFQLPREVYVIQTSVDRLRPELVAERQPLVVQDRVYDALPLAQDLLRFQRLHTRSRRGVHLSCLGRPLRTVARATFVSPKTHELPAPGGEEDLFVVRARPLRGGSREAVDFRLRTSQVLVLPAHWEVSCGDRGGGEGEGGGGGDAAAAYGIDIIEVFDFVHLVMWPSTHAHPRHPPL